MKMNKNLKHQIAAWKNGRVILNAEGQENAAGFWGFYDWFCKDASLRIRAERLMPKVIRFVKSKPNLNLEKHYVFFKNNCPMSGPTYDDFRICDAAGDVVYTVSPCCTHTGKAEVWGRENGFSEPIATADNFKDLFEQELELA